MLVDLDDEKRQLLIELVRSRIAELHPTIRRCRVSSVTDSLKHDLEVMEETLKQLTGPQPHSVS
jgi:hypothetical protein